MATIIFVDARKTHATLYCFQIQESMNCNNFLLVIITQRDLKQTPDYLDTCLLYIDVYNLSSKLFYII